jgi:heptosyltransferase-1
MSGVPAAAPRRVLIIRLSALGDVVMASGLIPALRAVAPDAHLAWLVEPAGAPLLRHNPRLDEVIVLPRPEWEALWRARRWIALARSVWRFRRALRERRYDLALDAQGLLKSAWCAWWSGAPRRISLIGREGSHRLATERVLPAPDPLRPIGAEYRALARYLGAPGAAFRMDLAVGAAPREQARARLAAAGVTGRYAVLCPYTTRPQKHWFDERWAELATRLAAAGLRPVLLGGPDDAPRAAAITRGAPDAVDLVGGLKLDETVAAIADAALLVGVDTGLTHMGTALDVPTIALFGSTRPYLDARTPRTVVLYEQLPCSPCRRHPTCGGRYDCMRLHTPAGVYAQAERLLGLAPDAHPAAAAPTASAPDASGLGPPSQAPHADSTAAASPAAAPPSTGSPR